MSETNYWARKGLTRRQALRSAAAGAGGIAALSLVGCGGDDATSTDTTAVKETALDPKSGKPGGFLRMQVGSYPATMVLTVSTSDPQKLAGMTHSGLVEFRFGTPAVPLFDLSVQPDLAQALPEQPDDLTYVFKLNDARFHNGRTVISQDVKYSFDRYAVSETSAYKVPFQWYDRTETPDPKTVVIKSKAPFGDGLTSMAGYTSSFIMAKEHEESPDAEKRLMGSGPFIFTDNIAPLSTKFKKNPDFFDKPYPYFDEVEVLGTSDDPKRIADLLSRQTHASYSFRDDNRTTVQKNRPDMIEWADVFSSPSFRPRLDIPPFNDKRVRQALSYALPRKQMNDGVNGGLGENDTLFSHTIKFWGFRKPEELGAAAKYWNNDLQAAKQLLSAAGVTQPIQADIFHTSTNQAIIDQVTLAIAAYREAGIANFKGVPQSSAQSASTVAVGNFEGIYLSLNNIFNYPTFGILLRSAYSSPPEGVRPPSQNNQRANFPQLTALVEKQMTQLKMEERKQTLRQLEDLFAEEQYVTNFTTYVTAKYSDPGLKNVQMSKYWFAGSSGYVKYWWWDKQPS